MNNDLDSNYSMTDIKKGSGSEWDDNQSQFTESNVIVVGDANSSYYGGGTSDFSQSQGSFV